MEREPIYKKEKMETRGTKQKMNETEEEEVKQLQGEDNTRMMEMIAQLIRQFTEAMRKQNRKAIETVMQCMEENVKKKEKLQEQNKINNREAIQ
ncbi:hypothetical protein FQA39_LY18055 [Lamprigera yunnana]|nr:hypothetical protein FQA39_LY18055 [Lamprigera yunnana]